MMTLSDRSWTQPIIDAVDTGPAVHCRHLTATSWVFTFAEVPVLPACSSCIAAGLTMTVTTEAPCARCNLPGSGQRAALRHGGIVILCSLCLACLEVCR